MNVIIEYNVLQNQILVLSNFYNLYLYGYDYITLFYFEIIGVLILLEFLFYILSFIILFSFLTMVTDIISFLKKRKSENVLDI